MNRPCGNCPFRRSRAALFGFRPERAREIAECVAGDGRFACHETIDYDDDAPDLGTTEFCAGALLTLENQGDLFANLTTRLAALGGEFDPDRLEGHDFVFSSLNDWLAAQGHPPLDESRNRNA